MLNETRGSTLWSTLYSDLKSHENSVNFKKSLTKNCRTIEQMSFSKGTTVNMYKDLYTFVYSYEMVLGFNLDTRAYFYNNFA